MKILTSQKYYGYNVEVKTPESPEELNYICNLSAAQKIYKDEDSVFYKLLNRDRQYINQMAAMTINDAVYGLAIVWEYSKRVVDLGYAKSLQDMDEYGFLRNAVGVFVPVAQRGGLIGSLMANNIMESFGKPVFCIGDDIKAQAFWTSDRVDKTHLEFMLTERATVRVNF